MRDSGGKFALLLLLCRQIGLLLRKLETGHDFVTSSDSKISGFTRPHIIEFVADLFFPLWRADLKISGIVVECAWIRLDGSRFQKETVADSKISGYVWTRPRFLKGKNDKQKFNLLSLSRKVILAKRRACRLQRRSRLDCEQWGRKNAKRRTSSVILDDFKAIKLTWQCSLG